MASASVVDFPNQELAANPKGRLGTFATRSASNPEVIREGAEAMIGKLAGAWAGKKMAGEGHGARGAILGVSAVAVGKRVVPTLAALALGGWAFKRWRDKRRAQPSYPNEATPLVPASETSSPS
jgi:hypothetical protein